MRPRIAAGFAVAAAVLLFGASGSDAQRRRFTPEPLTGPARVECTEPADAGAPRCRVDLATYVGRRVFEARCASCHGADGLGSTFAPALTERMAGMSRDAFLTLLQTGYPGDAAALPVWGEDPSVMQYADALFVYLEARANGTLPPGPVARLGNFAPP